MATASDWTNTSTKAVNAETSNTNMAPRTPNDAGFPSKLFPCRTLKEPASSPQKSNRTIPAVPPGLGWSQATCFRVPDSESGTKRVAPGLVVS